MIPFADTNWLVAAYLPRRDEGRARITERFTDKRRRCPWRLSPLVYLEARNVFGHAEGGPHGKAWQRLSADLGGLLQLETMDWLQVQQRAFALSERYSHKAKLGSFDLAIIAHAGLCGATHFLCFDTNSCARALAAAERMQVWPPLVEADKAKLAALRH